MQFIKTHPFISSIALLAVLVLGYYQLSGGQGGAALTSSADSAVTPASQELLVTLANLNTIKLDATVFNDPAFASLTDFGVTIPPQPAGRRNPFLSTTGSAQTSSTTPILRLPLGR